MSEYHLITYQWTSRHGQTYVEYSCHKGTIAEWVIESIKDEEDTRRILFALPLTAKEYAAIDGPP